MLIGLLLHRKAIVSQFSGGAFLEEKNDVFDAQGDSDKLQTNA